MIHCGNTGKGSDSMMFLWVIYVYHKILSLCWQNFHCLGFGSLVFSILEGVVVSPMSRKKRIQSSWSSLLCTCYQCRSWAQDESLWDMLFERKQRHKEQECMLKSIRVETICLWKRNRLWLLKQKIYRRLKQMTNCAPDKLCKVHFTTKLPLHQSANFHSKFLALEFPGIRCDTGLNKEGINTRMWYIQQSRF